MNTLASASSPSPSATKTRILDAAEKLFGEMGFDATSLRDITAEAQVNLAAVNYHFHSKDSLIDAVIERRIRPVNERRMEMLRAAGPTPTVEQVVEAFLFPLSKLDVLPAVPLIGRILSNPDQFFERVYKRHLVEIANLFMEAIGRAVPGLPKQECFWRLHFMAGSMSHVLALSATLPRMLRAAVNGDQSAGQSVDQPLDRHALIRRMTEFLAAGLRAPHSGAVTSRKPVVQKSLRPKLATRKPASGGKIRREKK